MLAYDYETIGEIYYEEINKVIEQGDDFKILTDLIIGKKIFSFLQNEKKFLSTRKTIFKRLMYFFHAFVGFSVMQFLPIWNRAILNGYGMDIVMHAHRYEFIFVKKPETDNRTIGAITARKSATHQNN